MAWPAVRLDECARIVSGATPSTSEPRFWDGDIHWATPKDLSDLDGSAYLRSTPRQITEEGLRSCSAEVLSTGSVLFSSRAPIGLVAINRVPVATNQGFKSFVPDPSKLDAKYLFHWLRANRDRLQALGNGATFKEVSKAIVSRIEVPLPPLPEQRRIAAILDQAEALRAKRREAVGKLDALMEAIFREMFGELRVATKSIGELLESGALFMHKDGNHGSLYPRADDFGDDGVPFISAQAITDGGCIDNTCIDKLRHDKAAKLKIGWIGPGDVLLAHNASVGKVALYDGRFEQALIGTSLTAFRPNPEVLDSRYLAAALRSGKFQTQLQKNMGQTTRNQVPITAQRRLHISMPPLAQQRDFARRSGAIDRLKAAYTESLVQLTALSASLQRRAFRGEV